MPGAALTGPERAEWVTFLNDIPGGAAKRDRFADLLAAAPAVGDAYTLQDIQALSPSPADVKATIESVANFRVGDVLAFMQYWMMRRIALGDIRQGPEEPD